MSLLSRLFGRDDTRVSPADFAARRAEAPVVDARTPAEFASGHLPGAVNLCALSPAFDRRAEALGLPAEGPVYVYCRSGHRSARAVGRLRRLGVAGAVNAGAMSALDR